MESCTHTEMMRLATDVVGTMDVVVGTMNTVLVLLAV